VRIVAARSQDVGGAVVRFLLEVAAVAIHGRLQAERDDAAPAAEAAEHHAGDRLLACRAVVDDAVVARDVIDLVRQ
jgi:hypothetical protein